MGHRFDYPNTPLSGWIAANFPEGYRGYCIDVGASDGMTVNSTFSLERIWKWTVLSVEANPFFAGMLKGQRAWVEMCALSSEPKDEATFHVNDENPESFSGLKISDNQMVREAKTRWRRIKVQVKTIDQLLEKWQFPKLDCICVDVEGGELDVLKGCDLEKWKPRCLVVESWQSGEHDDYLGPFGYKRVARSLYNDLYTRDATNSDAAIEALNDTFLGRRADG